jgi:hypothetical protein
MDMRRTLPLAPRRMGFLNIHRLIGGGTKAYARSMNRSARRVKVMKVGRDLKGTKAATAQANRYTACQEFTTL